MKKNVTCISCPLGCQMVVEEKDGVYTVTGNTCKNGEKYGIEEVTDPRRVIPTTVVINGALMARLPVKTADAIPKGKIFDAMKVINKVVVNAPIKCGDIIVKDILGTGIDVVATKTMTRI
ncbi:MAG: DUF1667 domain-containing protein [Eubacterium sp.]